MLPTSGSKNNNDDDHFLKDQTYPEFSVLGSLSSAEKDRTFERWQHNHSIILTVDCSCIHCFSDSFIRSFVPSFLLSFLHPFIHSFIQPGIQPTMSVTVSQLASQSVTVRPYLFTTPSKQILNKTYLSRIMLIYSYDWHQALRFNPCWDACFYVPWSIW